MIQHVYHSHPATKQDRWVLDRLANLRGGYFVEIGAHDGLHRSNTATLEFGFDWEGLLVEADIVLARQAKANRPNSKVIQAAICESARNDGRFMRAGSYGGLVEYLPQEFLSKSIGKGCEIVSVPTLSLGIALRDAGCPRQMDYLSIDVEGAEEPILQGFFGPGGGFLEYQFKVVTVEFRYDYHLLNRIEALMSPHYRLDEIRGFDACFVNTRF